ncbi:MAG: allophanate hydrolase subunit 1, partial [Paracoccaceae bacterium]
AQVIHLDAVLAATGFIGFVEAVPAYASLLVEYDPLLTDPDTVEQALRAMLLMPATPKPSPAKREVLVCYDPELAPDLTQVAQATGLSVESVIAAHLAGDYRVFMYGFAPGYAYLAGVPTVLHLPRKPAARRGVAAGSVIIAGAQCLVTTLTMPTGWWIIGRSPTRILQDNPARPFLFDVGDHVHFRRISRSDFDALGQG